MGKNEPVALPEEVPEQVERVDELIHAGRERPERLVVGRELGWRLLGGKRRRLLACVDQPGARIPGPVAVRVADAQITEASHVSARLPIVDRSLRFDGRRIGATLVAEHMDAAAFAREAREPVAGRRAERERLLGKEMRNVRIKLGEQCCVIRELLRGDDPVELLGLEQLAVIAVDTIDAVARRNKLGRALPRFGESDELALFAKQGVTADMRELTHEAGSDEPDPQLRGHALPVGDRAARMLEDRQPGRLVRVAAAELDVEPDAPAGLVRQLEIAVREHERLR